MWFWRQENFEGLADLALKAKEHGYEGFSDYCVLREKGLRKDAIDVLTQFISTAKIQSPEWRREFVDWLSLFCFYNPSVHDACPAPLKQQIMVPTIEEWTLAEPNNPKALRWNTDERAMMVAARTIPRDEVAVGRFAMAVLNHVDYATHELPSGYLGDSAENDLADVQTVIDLLHTVPDAPFFHPLREEALSAKMLLQKHLAKD